jgi:DNA-binding XRE family transcriptional regulator
LTLTDASAQIGITRQTLRGLERGGQEPHYPTLRKIADGYGVPVEELLEEPVLLGKGSAPDTGQPHTEEPVEEPEQPEVSLEVELTKALWKSLAKRARTLRQRYHQGITYEGFSEDLARLAEDHRHLERLRRAREGAPRAYHMEPDDELADAIEDVLAEENAISTMIEQDLDAPEEMKQQIQMFRQQARRQAG